MRKPCPGPAGVGPLAISSGQEGWSGLLPEQPRLANVPYLAEAYPNR
jgi:hypothetical protein